jgi:IS5 family transposase
MRKNIHEQLPLVAPWIEHEIADELRAIDERLKSQPAIGVLVWEDLLRGVKNPGKGREGLSGDTVLRALFLKQKHGWSYKTLSFHLKDSETFRRFCLLGLGEQAPALSTLQANIKRIRAETLEAINRLVLGRAADEGVEKGRKVRFDCTSEETNIHEPMDSEQLWDCVRVLVRLLRQAQGLVEIEFTDHTRRAKRRRKDAWNAKKKKPRKGAYRDLLRVTRSMVEAARRGVQVLESGPAASVVDLVQMVGLAKELTHYADLADKVIDQTHRRIILDEKVPAAEKVLSIFEEHTDIIIKGNRGIEYGHKICLGTGASGLILDVVVEDGNPADSDLALRCVERQADLYGRVPRQVAFDGGFASKQNLADIKAAGVKDVAFNKSRGLKVEDMVKSDWVYRQLYNFRAGVEAGISFLKRCFGLRRCTWKGLASFKAYTWASVLSANLLILARHDLA